MDKSEIKRIVKEKNDSWKRYLEIKTQKIIKNTRRNGTRSRVKSGKENRNHEYNYV